MPDAHTAERLRRRTIHFLAEPHPWSIDEDEHPTRLDPVEAELELALDRKEARESG